MILIVIILDLYGEVTTIRTDYIQIPTKLVGIRM